MLKTIIKILLEKRLNQVENDHRRLTYSLYGLSHSWKEEIMCLKWLIREYKK